MIENEVAPRDCGDRDGAGLLSVAGSKPEHTSRSSAHQLNSLFDRAQQAKLMLDRMSAEHAPPARPPALRPYQRELSRDIDDAFESGVRRCLAVAPTGAGKTQIIGSQVRTAAARGRRILILVHRAELVEQVGRALACWGVAHGVIVAGQPETKHHVQVASVATLARRLEAWRGRFDLVIVDEGHHAVAGSWVAVLASQPQAVILGLTATPERLDGRGLGEIFDRIVVGPSVAWLIASGYLCSFVVYEPAKVAHLAGAQLRAGDFVAADLRRRSALPSPAAILAEWRRLADGLPTLIFAIDCAESMRIAAELVAAGVPAVHVDGETPAAERAAALAGLTDGRIKAVCNVALFGEGIDCPNVAAVVLAKPTASLSLHLQMLGRALRLAPGKPRAVILDMVGNCGRLGLPDAHHEWSLDAKSSQQRDRSAAPKIRKCQTCFALNAAGAHACAACSADSRTPRDRHETDVRLAELRRHDAIEKLKQRPLWWRIRWAGADPRRLELIAQMHGFKPGWAYYQRQRALGSGSLRGTA